MDIAEVFRENGIAFVESGKNVKAGYLGMKCPWCGEEDPSEHLGIDPETGAFSCWRNIRHSGRRPQVLLMKLLGCSFDVATGLLGRRSELKQLVMDKLVKRPTSAIEVDPEEYRIPQGVRRLNGSPEQHKYRQYLAHRGYRPEDIPDLTRRYGLMCGQFGRFNNRVVFPVVLNGKLVGCVGRCIDGGVLRYLSEPAEVKQHILWHNWARHGGRDLVVCEGPFDALRINYHAQKQDIPITATCLFGVSHTEKQLEELRFLAPRFHRVVVLFDNDALSQAVRLVRTLAIHNAALMSLPPGVEDPGALSQAEFAKLTWE